LDQIPAWFLKIAAPLFRKLLANFFNLSTVTSTVPAQWKAAYIRPASKVASPPTLMPISDPYPLRRFYQESWKKIVVRRFLYPPFTSPPTTLNFSDQYAFRPTGCTTAALIFILHTVTRLLTTHLYVVVIALDFSKAFDNVRRSTILNKMADLDIPNHVDNWLVSYFSGHSHCTRYGGESIQGSGIGPASYQGLF